MTRRPCGGMTRAIPPRQIHVANPVAAQPLSPVSQLSARGSGPAMWLPLVAGKRTTAPSCAPLVILAFEPSGRRQLVPSGLRKMQCIAWTSPSSVVAKKTRRGPDRAKPGHSADQPPGGAGMPRGFDQIALAERPADQQAAFSGAALCRRVRIGVMNVHVRVESIADAATRLPSAGGSW